MTATSVDPEQLELFTTPTPARRPRGLTIRNAATALGLLLLTALAVFLGLRIHANTERESGREAAVAAASAEVTQVWTISSASSDQALKRLMEGATGSFKAQLGQQSSTFQQVLRQQGVAATGSVVQSGLVSLKGNRAVALVAVDARITSPKAAQPQTRQYRMQVRLERSGKRWLVADLGFVS